MYTYIYIYIWYLSLSLYIYIYIHISQTWSAFTKRVAAIEPGAVVAGRSVGASRAAESREKRRLRCGKKKTEIVKTTNDNSNDNDNDDNSNDNTNISNVK